jgi:hypothetical protein
MPVPCSVPWGCQPFPMDAVLRLLTQRRLGWNLALPQGLHGSEKGVILVFALSPFAKK